MQKRRSSRGTSCGKSTEREDPLSLTAKENASSRTGDGKAGFGSGNFFAEPLPRVKVHPSARRWHAAKVLFERDWLRRWF
jgi:sulfide:quinone oxidoreductase